MVKTTGFSVMGGPELVAAHNDMVDWLAERGVGDVQKTKRFGDRKAGVRRCEALAARVKELAAGAAAQEEKSAPDAGRTLVDAHTAEIEAKGAEVKRFGVSTGEAEIASETSQGVLITVAGKTGFVHEWGTWKEEKKAGAKSGLRADRAAKQIVPTVDKNPKKPGSDGARHFDAMANCTIGNYVGKFPEGRPRKTANQWLSNFLRDGSVKLVDPK